MIGKCLLNLSFVVCLICKDDGAVSACLRDETT
nr:MAG TPA: hypothetical protein [Bacteriophage sp.]